MIQLYKHQEQGKKFLLSHKKACLFFEVGTGKTYAAKATLTELPPGKVLIVAPKRVIDMVWLKEKEFPLNDHFVEYISYQKIARNKDFQYSDYDYIVLDEVHKIKGRSTKTSRYLRKVCTRAKYVFGLTGTPVANNYADVYNIFRNMNVIEFEMSYDAFVTHYYYTKHMNVGNGYGFNILLSAKQVYKDELIERIGKHSMVKKAVDCIDLPEKRTVINYIKGMNSDKYKEISKSILKTETSEKTMIKLETINKMHQAANGYFYTNGVTNIIKDNKKLIELGKILEDLLEETERVIIVYQYKEDLRQLQTLQYDCTCNPDEFENKQILFLQYNQSEGLNLQYCNQMIFYTYDYSYLNYEQMCGRIYRSGQKNNVTYTILINENTIEEKIWNAVKNKKSTNEYLKEVLSE